MRLIDGLNELNLPLRLLLHNKITSGNQETADRVESEIRKVAPVPVERIRFLWDFQRDTDTPLYDIQEDLTSFFERTDKSNV
jgi:hypothetical protein